ncbi:MAG TPA: hypothetical protein VM029_03905 [Opitutaceae bacterium]|nr:hypothetical protein [Opitutaceae bacterium]
MNDPRHPWARLVAAARQASDERDASAPYGFATRVAALAVHPQRTMASLLERFSLRAVSVAGLLALASIAMNYQHIKPGSASDAVVADAPAGNVLPADESLAIVLDFSAD